MVKTMPRLFGRRRKSEIEAGPNWSWKINLAAFNTYCNFYYKVKTSTWDKKIAKMCQKITKPGKMQYFLAPVFQFFKLQ